MKNHYKFTIWSLFKILLTVYILIFLILSPVIDENHSFRDLENEFSESNETEHERFELFSNYIFDSITEDLIEYSFSFHLINRNVTPFKGDILIPPPKFS